MYPPQRFGIKHVAAAEIGFDAAASNLMKLTLTTAYVRRICNGEEY